MNELSITYNKDDMELLRFTPLSIDDEARQKRAKAMAAHYSHPIEIPNLYKQMRVAVYIRYFNSADIEDWLDAIKKFYTDGLANIPAWTFVDFYIDEGPSPNNMENNKEWCRLLDDCFAGKVDLIMTQKTTGISKNPTEITMCARILSQLEKPVGIYFEAENFYTLASYYLSDTTDGYLLPSAETLKILDEPSNERRLLGE